MADAAIWGVFWHLRLQLTFQLLCLIHTSIRMTALNKTHKIRSCNVSVSMYEVCVVPGSDFIYQSVYSPIQQTAGRQVGNDN